MNYEIADFSIEDFHEAVSLWEQSEGIGLSSADLEDNIHSFLKRNPGMSFVARDKGVLFGAVLCGHDGRRGYIHHLAVHPRYRNKGIGRILVERCIKALKSAGIQKSHLFIFNDNLMGIKFWKKLGWIQRSDISVLSKFIGTKE